MYLKLAGIWDEGNAAIKPLESFANDAEMTHGRVEQLKTTVSELNTQLEVVKTDFTTAFGTLTTCAGDCQALRVGDCKG